MKEDKKWILLFCCVAVYSVYYLIPYDKSAPFIKPFPFSDQELTLQAYAHFASTYVSRLFFIVTIQAFAEKHHRTFAILFWVEVIGIVNFCTRYGEPFYYPQFDMMTIRYFVWGSAAAIHIIRNHKKLKYEAR